MRQTLGHAAAVLATIGALSSFGCSAILGLEDKPLGVDSGTRDSSTRDSGTHDAAAQCAPDDAGYHDMSAHACWSTYPVPAELDDRPDYAGGSFDGRYAYFVSNLTGLVVRYDSSAPFSSDSAWESYSTTALQGDSNQAYAGVVFDGRYMYFIPSQALVALFIRYDTKGAFDSATSWTTFTLDPADPVAYQGGAFDGTYIYFAPYEDVDGNNSGHVARYDTRATFTAASSWSTFDSTTIPGVRGGSAAFLGAVFDGRHVYFVPSGLAYNVVARYDTTADFASKSSWETFDTGNVNSNVDGFATGMFDGKYVYIVPSYASETALQYDITRPFTSVSSWGERAPAPGSGPIGSIDTPSFAAGGFDGRFIYFPSGYGGNDKGLLVRHDTSLGFVDDGSWTTFDVTSIHAHEFGAGVFDGRYLYLAPSGSPSFARFDAKERVAQPPLPHYFGSFF